MSRKPHHLTWLAHVLRSFVHQKFVSIKRCFHALLHGPPREFLQGASNTTVLLIYVPIKQIYIYMWQLLTKTGAIINHMCIGQIVF